MIKKYEKIAKEIEDRTGWSINNKDEIKDKKSAIRVFNQHIDWVFSNAEESTNYCRGLLQEAGICEW